MTEATKINAARAYGSIAFANGQRAIPGADANCMALLDGMQVGQGAVKIMKAWVAGWTQACLAA